MLWHLRKDKVIKIKGYYAVIFAIIYIVLAVAPLPLLTLTPSPTAAEVQDAFLVYYPESGEIEEVSRLDYVVGVLAGEMSPDAPQEALKAQAVAAYTYALYKRSIRLEGNGEYDLSCDSSADQKYLNKTEQVALWQENYSKNRKLLEDAARAVEGVVITFSGKPILALYHAVSSGKTETAKNIWGADYPYLQSVESAPCLLSPNYLSEVVFTPYDFADKALDLGITLVGEPQDWLSEPERSYAGYVVEYTLSAHKVSGSDMRSAFGLASTNFELQYLNEKFYFTVKGWGHGVGMSQFGAIYMAEQGSSYEQILVHYYKGTVLEKITPSD